MVLGCKICVIFVIYRTSDLNAQILSFSIAWILDIYCVEKSQEQVSHIGIQLIA